MVDAGPTRSPRPRAAEAPSPCPAATRHRSPPPPGDHARQPPGGRTPPPGGRPAGTPAGDSPFARLTAAGAFRVPERPRREDGSGRQRRLARPRPGGRPRPGPGTHPLRPRPAPVEGGRPAATAPGRKFRDDKRLLDRRTCRRPSGPEDLRAYPWHQLTVEDAQDFHRAVYRRYDNQSTRNDVVCTLRAIVVECYATGLISALRREELLEALYTTAPGRSTRRHRITDDEFDALHGRLPDHRHHRSPVPATARSSRCSAPPGSG